MRDSKPFAGFQVIDETTEEVVPASRKSKKKKGDSAPLFTLTKEDRDRISVQLETITPEKAWEYLEKNTNNYRGVIPRNLAKLVADMQSGRWRFCHNPIAFDASGVLVDGQHRLVALVEADHSAEFLVIRGLPEGEYDNDVIDCGAPRSANQILGTTHGMSNSMETAALVRFLYRFLHGTLQHRGGVPLSNTAIAEIAVRYPGLNQAVVEGTHAKRRGICTAVACAAWFSLAMEEDAEAARECLDILLGEKAAMSNHPFVAVKQPMSNVYKTREKMRIVDASAVHFLLLMSAWVKRGKEVQRIRAASESKALSKLFKNLLESVFVGVPGPLTGGVASPRVKQIAKGIRPSESNGKG